MDAFLSYAGKPLGFLMGWIGLAVGLDGGSVFLLIGAVVYAVAVWRSRSRDVLRQENEDVTSRNVTLEAQLARAEARNEELTGRPDLESLATLLTKLIVSVENHDSKQSEVWAETLKHLQDIRVAVVPPERIRDD